MARVVAGGGGGVLWIQWWWSRFGWWRSYGWFCVRFGGGDGLMVADSGRSY